MKHEIITEDFRFSLEVERIDSGTELFLFVCSNDFGAKARYTIEISDVAWFANRMWDLYEKLEGNVSLEDCDGDDFCITFEVRKCGYIQISGYLVERTYGQELHFQNEIEQSYVKEFCYGLKKECGTSL